MDRVLIEIRLFAEADAPAVRGLFVRVNRLLAPAHLAEAFEGYIKRSLVEEMDRIADYYREKGGGFWVARHGADLVGIFGLEPSSANGMELRRMYVDPGRRRQGIAWMMLTFAEEECRRRGFAAMDLSTSELQGEARAFYRKAGYEQIRDEVVETSSNKTIGGGVRRFHFTKRL
jgi:putative acetyltransferase